MEFFLPVTHGLGALPEKYMNLILRGITTAVAAAAVLGPMLPAQAKSVSTPILTLTDNSPGALDFHLVSESAGMTVIQFDGLSALMQGAVATPASGPAAHQDLSTSQTFNLAINHHYAPVYADLVIDVSYSVNGGASWADNRLTYTGSTFFNNYSQNDARLEVTGGGAGRQTVSSQQVYGCMFDPAWCDTTQNDQQLKIQLDAALNAESAPWNGSDVSFRTNSVKLYMSTHELASPVPEPASLPLMLGGLGVLAAVAKRRKQARQAPTA